MKKLIFTFALTLIGFLLYGQTASQLIPTQGNNPKPTTPPNYLYVDVSTNRIWPVLADSLRLKYINVQWLNDSVIVIADRRYVKLSGSYPNPSFINSLASSKVTGLSTVATSGDYNDLSSKPNLSVYETTSHAASTFYQLSNPSGYISSVPAQSFTSLTGKPTTLVGYGITDAYPLTGNPSGFLTSQYVPTINSTVARTLNSNFTISSSKQATVTYSVSLSATNPLLVGTSSAAAYLEYSINGGSSWVSVSDALISSSVGITVTVAITSTQTQIVSGSIPANALARIRTTTTGTASVVYVRGQETY